MICQRGICIDDEMIRSDSPTFAVIGVLLQGSEHLKNQDVIDELVDFLR